MAGRIPVPALAAAVVLSLSSPAPAAEDAPATVLVRYGFDDDDVATGPDTFAVFRAAHGRVGLTSAFRRSGYRAVEIRDAADNGDFSELQGYFPLQRTGHVFAHFALLTARPEEELNIALAGPRRFQLGKDGIAFWLATRGGRFVHTSDSIPKRLAPVQAFVWYLVDVDYDVDAGRYDLTIREEGRPEPVVALRGQPGASRQPASAVDVFSFISDPMEDASEVTYYLDDVVIATSRGEAPPPLVAPGRRKLFVDAFTEHRRQQEDRACPVSTGIDDFGLAAPGPADRVLLALEQVLTSLTETSWRGLRPDDDDAAAALDAASEWRRGCAALAEGEAEQARQRFERAARLAPGARLYPLSLVVALAALGRLEEAQARLAAIGPQWEGDARHAVVAARVASALGQGSGLEALRAAAESGDRVAAERYQSALLWHARWREAREWAVARAAGASSKPERAGWLERAGDAAFQLRDLGEARELYDEAWALAPAPAIVLKLADVAFLQGDLESERRHRERYFGTLDEP